MNALRTRSLLPAVTLALAACGSSRATPPVTAPHASAADAAVTASADVPAPSDPRRDAVLAAWRAVAPSNPDAPAILAGPVDYPGGDGARVAAVVGSGGGATLVVTPVPYAEGAQATASITLSAEPASAIAGMSVRDINRDGRPDVAVFLREEYRLENYLPFQHFALFFSLQTTPERSMAPMIRAELELLGVRDDASLAAALPTLGSYEAPSEGLSPVRFIARLHYATPAQFRQAVASTGLRLCTDLPDRTGNRRKRCNTVPVARITDALYTSRIRGNLGAFVEVLVDDPSDLTAPSCLREGQEIHCNANIGGPAGTDWALVGEGASLRIIEVSPWAESS